MRLVWRTLCAALGAAILLGGSGVQLLFGQTGMSNGAVVGRITDATGAVVAGATINLTDTATSEKRSALTNAAGLYAFREVKPGTYNFTAAHPGFRTLSIPGQQVTTGLVLTLNGSLEVGAVTETVQVTATADAELQTMSSTMGSSLGGDAILQLPTIARDVSALLFVQPTAAPTFNGAEGNITSGQIAGNMSDQNTFQLDGGNNTSDLDGDNGTYVGLRGGAMPTPVESVEEFRVNTNNMAADFASSGGGQVMITTKRGSNQFHGSLYDFFQADWLSSNDWDNNFHGTPKPKSHYNRFGGSIGGPMLPDFLGGKTYFFANYEGERYPRTGPFEKAVPSDTLRQGIIQVRDATGTPVQYNLKTASVCGAAGDQLCDPRGLGISPVVSTIWNKYMPKPNDFTYGDRLNTFGYRANLSFPLSTDFGVVRIDHDFSDKWRFFASYRYFQQNNPTTSQVDIGGLLPGDTLGIPATASSNPFGPRYLVTGLTTNITPSLTNEFHFNYLRNFWQWLRPGAYSGLPGVPGGVEIGGDSGSALIPMNMNTQAARARLWNGHDFDYRDGMSWLKGTHFLQFGGEFMHQWFHFDRYDNVVGGLTQLKYIIQSGGLKFTPDFQPVPCTAARTADCLPSSQVGNYRGLYSDVLGLVAQANVVATRTGANLQLNPIGTPLASYSTVQNYTLYVNDIWRIRPSVTLNYGLNWSVQMPPYELNGAQDTLVTSSNQPITTQGYLDARLAAANSGQNYNPTLGFSPVGAVHMKYPYNPYYKEFAPRFSIAWNPSADSGFWGKLLGNRATVIRAGYGRFYTKNLGIDLVSSPTLGDGFLNPVSCVDPTRQNACTGSSGSTPATAFRLGADGNVVPLPNTPQTLQSPVLPGVNAAYENLNMYLDSAFRPGPSDQIDISIQRQLKGGVLLELGYVGVFARNLYQGVDINTVPYMMKLNGQTFAQAYSGLYKQLNSNQKVTPQPWFEAALGGTGYCSGYANCTAAVADQEGSNVLTQAVSNLWSDLDSSFAFGPSLLSTNQAGGWYGNTASGYSNYNALVVTAQKRTSHGLTLNANFTWAKSLGILGLNQAYVFNNLDDVWHPRVDYGPQYFDRKFVFNMLGTYTLPFGKGQRFANTNPVATRVLGGWSLSPIFSLGSGLPLAVITGSGQELGNGFLGNGACTAIPTKGMSYNNGPVYGVTSDGNVGVNGDAANGGSGVNMFANPTAVYNNFQPFILGVNGSCGGAGILRGQLRWNLDLGLTKETQFTERVGLQIYAQAFNVLNHMQWGDPSMNLQDPNNFGVLGGQYNPLTLGGYGASANFTRIIQLGVRVHF